MKKFPFDVALDDIRSAHNVGAIFRTCDGAGVRKLYLGGITPYPPHNRIPKTALGATEYVDWERAEHLLTKLQELRGQGATIIAVEQTKESKPFHQVNYPENTVLVFGNEITGVRTEIVKLANFCVELPMFGHKESLNIATTVGIMCYHLAVS
ncbi:RNA methyltransferase [Candidatus Dojkabacteria bacterium]|uniref:RNA methyltransferase n=1 Tax=Candidatus Dojkabacteria bacterium TaxID=2099670 RepID=A0A955I4P4_9BACT|nr:RNA methyltransferase [Candidatus Dojkabacteria bacterium]